MPKVSVIVPTYNHGAFIAQTLENIVAQKTNFEIEVLVGDDASKDNNALIIKELVNKYPEKIKAFLHNKNLGPASPPELGGKNNVAFLFAKAQGEYIALCEGDDYWTNEYKLQKQVDFLENNSEFALCHHQMNVVYEDDFPTHFFNSENQSEVSTLENLLKDDSWILGTASTVFRNTIRGQFPKWWMETASGDLGIFILVTQFGKIKYFSEPMASYRKHKGGMTTIHTPQNRFFLENRMQLFIDLKAYFKGQYNDILDLTIEKYRTQIHQLK